MATSSLLTHCLVFFFFIGTAVSAPFISGRIFEAEKQLQSHESNGRNLLQTNYNCGLNFRVLNYTTITSKCKGPRYHPRLCCPAFKKFACPAVDEINNMNTDCATIMFSYINMYGKYPPGLFADICVEGQAGLDCTGYAKIKQQSKRARSKSRGSRA